MTQDDRMETITAETDNPTVCITHGRFIPCRNEDWHHFTDNPYWVKSVRDFQGSDDPNLTWEPATLTITDPAVIRATDEPDPFRRNPVAQTGPDDPWRFTRFVADDHECVIVRDEYDEPAPFGSCSTHRRALSSPVALGCTTPAPVGAAVALDIEPEREAGELDAGGLRHLLGLRSEALARVAARAEAAEAEVATLRARLAAVEALADQWADRKRSDGMSGNAWIGLTLSGVAADLRAALATTGEGQ